MTKPVELTSRSSPSPLPFPPVGPCVSRSKFGFVLLPVWRMRSPHLSPRPSFITSSRSAVSMSPSRRPSSPASSSRLPAPSPLGSPSHLSRYSSSLTSGITKGLASLAGTAATAAGGVGALTGLTGRNEVIGDDPEGKPDKEGRYGVRATVGGWLGSGRRKGKSQVVSSLVG